MLARVIAFGALGCAAEYAFTIAARRPKVPSPWMLPIYGLAAPLFPPVRRALRARPAVVRGALYAGSLIVAEYVTGRILRELVGGPPWRYSSRFAIDGVARIDYFPLWMLYGLVLERLDDALRLASRGRGEVTDVSEAT